MKNTLKVLLVLMLCFVTIFAVASCAQENDVETGDNKADVETAGDKTADDKTADDETVGEDAAEGNDLSKATLAGHEDIPFEEALNIYCDALKEMAYEQGVDDVKIDMNLEEGWSGEGAPDAAELSENEEAYTFVLSAELEMFGETEESNFEICVALDTDANVYSVKALVFTTAGEYDYSYSGDMAVEYIEDLYNECVL